MPSEGFVELPKIEPCIGPELVSPSDVLWYLAPQKDKPVVMQVTAGVVTGYLRANDTTVAQVENDSVRLRGFVKETTAVMRSPFLHDEQFVPNGERAHHVGMREDGLLAASIRYLPLPPQPYPQSGWQSSTQVLPCSAVTLQRHQHDGSGLLPEAKRQVVVAQEADIQLRGQMLPLALFTVTRGSKQPVGALATWHAGPAPKGQQRISLGICGGTLLGTVPSSAILGPPRDQPWTLPSCHESEGDPPPPSPPLEHPLTCERELTLYLRQIDSLAAVAVLKPGARIQVDGKPHDGRVFVTVADLPFRIGVESCLELSEAAVTQHCRSLP